MIDVLQAETGTADFWNKIHPSSFEPLADPNPAAPHGWSQSFSVHAPCQVASRKWFNEFRRRRLADASLRIIGLIRRCGLFM